MNHKFLVSAFAALTLCAGAAGAIERSDDIARSFDLAAGGSVLVDNVFGDVTVRAGAPGRVTVAIHRVVRARSERAVDQGMREVTFESSQPSADRLELGQDGPFRCRGWLESRGPGRDGRGSCVDWNDPDYEVSWSWTVTVPADVELTARTVNGGDLLVEGVRGPVVARNVNGAVRLRGLAAAVEAATVNGRLEASFDRTPPADSSFDTINGEIEIALPDGAAVEVGFKSLNGDLYSDFETTAVAQQMEPARDSDGRHRYRVDHSTLVRIGRGGPRLDCHTINGDIVVRAR